MVGDTIKGRFVDLVPICVEDAEFTRNLRMDSRFIPYFPYFSNTLEEQKEWIKNQRKKDGDYFFVVWNKNGERIGTIGLYAYDGEKCEAGRLAIMGNAFQSIEAQLLSFDYAFNVLGVKQTVSYIFKCNERALRFSKNFGGTFEDDIAHDSSKQMVKKTTTKDDFNQSSIKIKNMIYREEK